MVTLVSLAVLAVTVLCAIGMYAIFGLVFDLADGVLSLSAGRWNVKTIGYLGFIVLFTIEVLVTATHADAILRLEPWQLLALGFAAFRVARTISFNSVMGWLREPFTVIVKDSSGAGDSVEPAGKGLKWVIGDLLCCPICTGTHAAGMLLALTALFPSIGLVAVYALAAAGMSETLHWHNERAEWQGRQAREGAGTEYLRKTAAVYLEAHRKPIFIPQIGETGVVKGEQYYGSPK